MSEAIYQFPPFSEERTTLQEELDSLADATVVVKVGGEILLHPEIAKNFLTDLLFLRSLGAFPVLCHGGGPQLSEAMNERGITPRFVHGHRVTDRAAIELTASVFTGHLNRPLTALLNSLTPCGIGISGIDGHCIQVHQRDPELGFVGDIQQIRAPFLRHLLHAGLIPVVAPLGVDAKGETYNINADMVAAHIARALQARALLLTTNVDGILQNKDEPGSLISSIKASELPELFSKGIISEGMLPKTDAAGLALEGGVESAHITNGFTPQSILLSLAKRPDSGTIVSNL
jgi:acetylglutamate kinase